MTELTRLEMELEEAEIEMGVLVGLEEMALDSLLSIRRSRHPEEWDVREEALGEIQDERAGLKVRIRLLEWAIAREDERVSYEELGWSL